MYSKLEICVTGDRDALDRPTISGNKEGGDGGLEDWAAKEGKYIEVIEKLKDEKGAYASCAAIVLH